MSIIAVIVAGGNSQRFGGDLPKQFVDIAGRPMLAWAIERFEAARSIDRIVVVVPEEHLAHTGTEVIDRYGYSKVWKLVPGGETRQESVYCGLQALPESTEIVLIHDSARPLVSPQDIDAVADEAKRSRAAMLATPANDTVKRVENGVVVATLDRDRLYLAETPQGFEFRLILEAHRRASHEGRQVTDDAQLIEGDGISVKVVESSSCNMKITSQADRQLAEALLQGEQVV
ncbi:MAG: 2-C-methyl-D-erythritol 4-phosphate cytidylyltransferase [Candidatus Zixiibacteriota bacterium]